MPTQKNISGVRTSRTSRNRHKREKEVKYCTDMFCIGEQVGMRRNVQNPKSLVRFSAGVTHRVQACVHAPPKEHLDISAEKTSPVSPTAIEILLT